MAQISDVNLWGGLTPVQLAYLNAYGVPDIPPNQPARAQDRAPYVSPAGTAWVPPAGQGPSTAVYSGGPITDPAVPLRQAPQAQGQAILPMLAQVLSLMNAAPRVTQLPTPTNWLGPGTGSGAGMSGLFGGSAGAPSGGQAEVISRALGLMPWLTAPRMNPFAGGGQAPALNRIVSPLWSVSRLPWTEDRPF